MEAERQAFLDAEETAQKLVARLEQLYTEAQSYQEASEALQTVRQELAQLVAETGAIAKETHEAVTVLKAIGGPEILKQLEELQNRVSGPDVAGRLAELERKAVGPQLMKGLSELRSIATGELSRQSRLLRWVLYLELAILIGVSAALMALLFGVTL